jgi:hypothetical protein
MIKNLLHEKVCNDNVPASMKCRAKVSDTGALSADLDACLDEDAEEQELLKSIEEGPAPQDVNLYGSGGDPMASNSFGTQNSRSDFEGHDTDMSNFFNNQNDSARANALMAGTQGSQLPGYSLLSNYNNGAKQDDERWTYKNENVMNGGVLDGLGVTGYSENDGYSAY